MLLRSALEQKKAEEIKEFGPIDYDAPISSDNNNNKTIGFGAKVQPTTILLYRIIKQLCTYLHCI
jgi:hypothetical protein